MCYLIQIHQIDELRFLGISQYKSRLRFWFNSDLYRQEFEFLDLEDFRGVAFAVETVVSYHTYETIMSDVSVLFRTYSCLKRGVTTLTTHCNALQRTATHCNTLQYTATQCNTMQHIMGYCNNAPTI